MKQFWQLREITCNFWRAKLQQYNTFLIWLIVPLLSGCQLMPKEPKKPDSSPKVPINKTIPPEIERGIYENPAN